MIHLGRYSADMPEDFVVFLIGMRMNKLWKIHRWLPVARAMPRMLKELEHYPDSGLLGCDAWFGRTLITVQYWRSIDHLLNYAKDRNAEHLPAWRSFNQIIGSNGDVGIWHETYKISKGNYEAIYVNMPAFGLGKVGELHPATGNRETAIQRLNYTADK